MKHMITNRTPKPRPRAASTLTKAQRLMRLRVESGPGVSSRLAQLVEATLLYARGYRIDLDEEIAAFTDIIVKETAASRHGVGTERHSVATSASAAP
jgi:hypothetical protein